MLTQELVLRKFGKDAVEVLLQDYHAFIFYLHTDDAVEAESFATQLMYDISMNLANEFLEFNWGTWVLIDSDTAASIGLKPKGGEDKAYYLMGFVTESEGIQVPKIEAFLANFIPGEYINFGRRSPYIGGYYGRY